MRYTHSKISHRFSVKAATPNRRRPAVQSGVWRLTSVVVALAATLCLLFAPVQGSRAEGASKAQPALPVVEATISDTALTMEMATSRFQRYMGLSYRKELPENHGMLFVFAREQPLTFSMRNTLIPLSIAFLSEDWVINEIHTMNVGPNQLFKSHRPAKYALEVNQGWFNRHELKPGDRVVIK